MYQKLTTSYKASSLAETRIGMGSAAQGKVEKSQGTERGVEWVQNCMIEIVSLQELSLLKDLVERFFCTETTLQI